MSGVETNVTTPSARADHSLESLSRGLRILESFSEEKPTLNVTEVAATVGLNKGTVSRFLHKLEELGYLDRDRDTKRYRPGVKVLQLGFVVLNNMGLTERAQRYLVDLSEETGLTPGLAIASGRHAVMIAKYGERRIVDITVNLGYRYPIHASSYGKALLLDHSLSELHELLGDDPLPVYGPRTIVSIDRLYEELQSSRSRGYVLAEDEWVAGVRAVGAPVRDAAGKIVASVCAGVDRPHSAESMEMVVAAAVVRAAASISATLGYRGDPKSSNTCRPSCESLPVTGTSSSIGDNP
jgi:IclR family transcriptional regulator, pca regulon regulatory protein